MPASLWILLDDIASVLDDVAALTKVATRKTAAVLGDDLALNAQQVAGVHADRELPVVWAVAKGSLLNKAILVPAAMVLSLFLPAAIAPLLLVGGLYLCFEGAEKILHRWIDPGAAAHAAALHEALLDPTADLAAVEADKIRGAIRTDFVLSAEIVVIALGSVQEKPWPTRALVLCSIALLMTVGVYGLVATIVKLDDAGLALGRARGTGAWAAARRALGNGLVRLAPLLMKGLTVAGTAAMFLVGGGIVVHVVPFLHHWSEHGHGPNALLLNGAVGMVAGVVLVGVTFLVRALRWRRSAAEAPRAKPRGE